VIGPNAPNPSFDHHPFFDFSLITPNPQPTTPLGAFVGFFFFHDLVVKTC
jgi:hypothetical protein